MEAGPPCRELNEHGHRTVRLRPWLCEEPLGDLALHHDAPARQRLRVLQRLDDERRGDVVREVGHELARCRPQLVDVDVERVPPDELDVRALPERIAKRGLERAVELDRVDDTSAIGEVAREHPETGADLENDVVGSELAQTPDDAEDVLVDEEVLAERLLRRDGHGNPKAAAAFACVAAASSANVSPRASASAAIVWTTWPGSFRRPRTGCGAR